MTNTPKVSVIIPVDKINKYITDEIIPSLSAQFYKNLELIIVPDQENKTVRLPDFVKVVASKNISRPVPKREIGVKHSKGEIIAFIDDDAYPAKNWLQEAVRILEDKNNNDIAAVCGPGVTPPSDNWKQKVSGWVWQTKLGAGGAGTYRCQPEKSRFVDDFPTFNLIIKRRYYDQVNGFQIDYWPGEDTKLCHDLVYKLNKKIVYEPSVKVFHHRREIFGPHLRQIGRYGFQRGRFVKHLPKTSLRIRYFLPLVFLFGLIVGPVIGLYYPVLLYLYIIVVSFYLNWLFVTCMIVLLKTKSLRIALALAPAILTTHLYYAFMFLRGLFS